MNKELARKLHVLITPEVQKALNLLLEDKREQTVKNMIRLDNEVYMYRAQGAVQELDWLLGIRDRIIERAENG